jgi:hypothetical protein
MEKETQCILDRYNLTKQIVANYYYSAYGIFPVVENLTYQYSLFIPCTSLNLPPDEFALVQLYVGPTSSTFSWGTLSYDVVVQNDHTGLFLDRVVASLGTFMVHVFKYV